VWLVVVGMGVRGEGVRGGGREEGEVSIERWIEVATDFDPWSGCYGN
jgi:hypothetical protein